MAAWTAAVLLALLALLGSPASAQVSVSASVQSDYLLRGVSLSDGRPTVSLDLAYDNASGFYAAVSAIGVDTRRAGVEMLGVTADAGYARRLGNGLSLDLGVTDTQLTTYVDERYVSNYAEVYAGLSSGGFAARLHFSPDYLGNQVRTLYVDVSETVRPADHWRLTAHGGLLEAMAGDVASLGGRSHLDFSAGVARDFGRFEARLTASWVGPPVTYPDPNHHSHAALVAGASVFF